MRVRSVCKNCGYTGFPITHVKGSCCIEIALWLTFLLPGVIYTVWRLSSKEKICPSCKKATMIPINTPIGRKLLKDNAARKEVRDSKTTDIDEPKKHGMSDKTFELIKELEKKAKYDRDIKFPDDEK